MDRFLVQGISMTVLGPSKIWSFFNGTTNQIVVKNSAKKNSTSHYLYEKTISYRPKLTNWSAWNNLKPTKSAWRRIEYITVQYLGWLV